MTDWLSASAMLLSGLIVGFMFIYGMKRRGEKTDLERKDLEAKRDALIAQLRTETNPQERTRLELAAAEVLKKLDGISGGQTTPAVPAAEAAAEATPKQARSAALIGFAWGAGSVAVLAGIGYFVMQQAKPKDQARAPQTMQSSAAAASQQPDAAVQTLEAAVQKNPGDLTARNDLAKAYLDRENMNGVIEQTQYVLQHAPEDARALTYEGLVRIAMGQKDAATQMLQRATKSDPNLLDAWVGLAWVDAQAGKMDQAKAAIDEAKRRHPDQAQRLDELMVHIKPATPIHITLTVAPGAQIPPGGVIYVMARPAGQSSGPPLAVRKIALGAFPLEAEISSADSMSGDPLPAKVHIDVRLDSDGNPMTKSPTDLTAAQDGVAVGQSISLTLK